MKKARGKNASKLDGLKPTLFRMRLLNLCREFQDEVKAMRKKYNIPVQGFDWLREFAEKSRLNSFSWEDLEKLNKQLVKFDHLFYKQNMFESMAERQMQKKKKFEKDILRIAHKFHLPFSMVENPFSGVPFYILANEIKVDMAYAIHPLYSSSNINQITWLNVRIYERLNRNQLEQLMNEVLIKQNLYFDSSLMLNIEQRKNIERDLQLVEQLKGQRGKAKKVKVYDSMYLDNLMKDPKKNAKVIREYEKKYPQFVKWENNMISPKQLSTNKLSANAISQARRRLNIVSKQWFGNPLNNDKLKH